MNAYGQHPQGNFEQRARCVSMCEESSKRSPVYTGLRRYLGFCTRFFPAFDVFFWLVCYWQDSPAWVKPWCPLEIITGRGVCIEWRFDRTSKSFQHLWEDCARVRNFEGFLGATSGGPACSHVPEQLDGVWGRTLFHPGQITARTPTTVACGFLYPG